MLLHVTTSKPPKRTLKSKTRVQILNATKRQGAYPRPQLNRKVYPIVLQFNISSNRLVHTTDALTTGDTVSLRVSTRKKEQAVIGKHFTKCMQHSEDSYIASIARAIWPKGI